jgi:hypothetical protein
LKALASHKSAEMVARSDAAALERETGIASDERHLDELNDRVAKRARAQHALQWHGAGSVRARLASGSSGRALEPLRPERMRLDLGQVGPFAASVGRLAPEHASITIGAAPKHIDDDDDACDDSRDARASDDARDDAPDDARDARDNAAREKRAYGGNTEELAARKEARKAKRNNAQTRWSSRCRRRARTALKYK